eukprot:1078685-Ditylum_brightwellii.AAC.1
MPSNLQQNNSNSYFAGTNSSDAFLQEKLPSVLCNDNSVSKYNCTNYHDDKINKALSDFNQSCFGVSQQSHVDSSSDEESHQMSSAYSVLKGDFATLCKLIDGDSKQVKE